MKRVKAPDGLYRLVRSQVGMTRAGLIGAAGDLAPILAPAVLFATVAVVFVLALRQGDLGVDFQNELYREAHLLIHGQNPLPAANASLTGDANAVFPAAAAFAFAPFLPLGPGPAAILVFWLSIAALLGSLRLLGVRDIRVYAIVSLWPATISALQTENLTVLLLLLVAAAWRLREREIIAGILLGLAVALKLFLWPLLLLLVAQRRLRGAAAGCAVALAGILAILPFASLWQFTSVIERMRDTFEPGSYNVAGLLIQAGATDRAVVHLVAAAVGLLVLAAALWRRSWPLAIGASLALSPIVWMHYYLLLAVPIALTAPRLRPVWLLPVLMWAAPGNGAYVDVRDDLLVLAIAVLTIAWTELHWERSRPPMEGVGPAAGRVLHESGASGEASITTRWSNG